MSESLPPTYRSDGVYVSWQTRKALGYVALKLGRDMTADALADEVLADWLKANHPDVVEHMKNQYETDQAFKKSLKPRVPFQ